MGNNRKHVVNYLITHRSIQMLKLCTKIHSLFNPNKQKYKKFTRMLIKSDKKRTNNLLHSKGKAHYLTKRQKRAGRHNVAPPF